MVSRFSAGYLLMERVDIRCWQGDEAVVPRDLYEEMVDLVGEPVVGFIDGVHYQFRPEHGLPGGEAMVPDENHDGNPTAFLLQG